MINILDVKIYNFFKKVLAFAQEAWYYALCGRLLSHKSLWLVSV